MEELFSKGQLSFAVVHGRKKFVVVSVAGQLPGENAAQPQVLHELELSLDASWVVVSDESAVWF